jgi:hypothetical protein
MEDIPEVEERMSEEGDEESERDRRLRVLHSKYDAALERRDWNSFEESYREYLDLYLQDDPHYADPMARQDYIQQQLERFRPRFGRTESSRERLISAITWAVFGLIALIIAYFLIWGTKV